MPIPPPAQQNFNIFPILTREQIDAARTSEWIDTFEDISFESTIIDLAALGEEEAFLQWLEEDSIFLPEGSEGRHASASVTITEEQSVPSTRRRTRSSPSSRNGSHTSDDVDTESEAPVYNLPKLNEAIRSALDKYGGAVFPKLNWTSPKDAAFILPQTAAGPLHCTSPADVYLLLKSSDFIHHDLDPARAYAGIGSDHDRRHRVEIVLKRFEDLIPSREVRCFVRNNLLIGVSQRDTVFYDHLQNEDTRIQICDTVRSFWEDEIRENFAGGEDYIFDLYLSPNLSSARIIDFNPYRDSTDPLTFTYEDLRNIVQEAFEPLSTTVPQTSSKAHTESADESTAKRTRLPVFRYIDSKAHPDVNRNAPAYQSNMMPLEMLEMSQGLNMAEFKEAWDEALAAGMTD
ncbi:cytoplasmic protein [Kwoniella heveanensis BCC8398]|uniref:Cytoplasmic protein n=1 Tax=Kwoniella heveanensis BCC8398 TaxID=1296120 RepID=A0A1B9H161_9TREE|nr:cytoplasmic protein [Kwoniella heveanensis BCC8398]